MFFALWPRPSFVEGAISTGRPLRKCDFTERVAGVSVMPAAILASVFPVHGATMSRSSSFFGPIGSA